MMPAISLEGMPRHPRKACVELTARPGDDARSAGTDGCLQTSRPQLADKPRQDSGRISNGQTSNARMSNA